MAPFISIILLHYHTNHRERWNLAIYTTDDTGAGLHTSHNKGHEASVYLSYIIENYHKLPSMMIFTHAHRTHKHGDFVYGAVDYDNLISVKRLNLSYVEEVGFANLRCILKTGCPDAVRPRSQSQELHDGADAGQMAMHSAWSSFFPEMDVPKVVAAPCCAQFAVSRKQVLQRAREEYRKYLRWLYETPFEGRVPGTVFEYLWHVIFGKRAVQ